VPPIVKGSLLEQLKEGNLRELAIGQPRLKRLLKQMDGNKMQQCFYMINITQFQASLVAHSAQGLLRRQ